MLYASLGWSVFPFPYWVQPGRQDPIPVPSPTTDPEIIREWWDRWPLANIGMETKNGLTVLEIDGDEGVDSLLSLGLDLPQTWEAVCSGRWELYFYSKKEVPTITLRPGLVLLGEGNYVVAPPSTVFGCRYEWVTESKGRQIQYWPEELMP